MQNELNDLTLYSKLWSAFKDFFYCRLQLEKYEDTFSFLRLANSVDLWFSQNNISLCLLSDDRENIQSHFLDILASNNYRQNKLIFDNFTQLMSLREVDKNEIQNILSLPWLDSSTLPPKITKNHIANAKSLDFATKVKCLEAITKYGKGRQRLNMYSMCISSCAIELGVAIVM